LFSWLANIGCLVSLFAVFAVFHVAWTAFRSDDREGSLVLPVAVGLGVIFPSLFALVYPYDWAAVLNPRYLLPIAMPMSACFGFTLAAWGSGPRALRVARWIPCMAVSLIGVLVLYERLGR